MSSRGAVAVVLATLALTACASAPAAEGGDRDTNRRLIDLERQAVRQRLEIERLERRVAALEARREAPEQPSAATTPRPAAALAPTPAEPATAFPASPTPPIEEADLVDESPAVAAGPAADRPLERYEAALAQLRSGQTSEAESGFRALLESGIPPDLADNAWFWIGEARLGRGDAAGAASAYRTAIERYPDGNKIPDALLKLGDALVELGDGDAAQEVWRELVERFPSTASAEIARPRLEPR